MCGARLSGKTWATLHKIARHLWDTPDASVAMFSKTMKNSKEGGTWEMLHKVILKEWIKGGFGFNYTTINNEGYPGWKVDGTTRTPYFRVRNRFGGESECRLFSLDVVEDIDEKIKEQSFSMIYFSELDKFDSRKVLSVCTPCLRMPHLSFDQQQWIADTNPSEEGENSWIYDVWYRERVMSYDEYKEYCIVRGLELVPEETFKSFQTGLELIEITPEQNPRLDPRKLEELKMSCAYDPGLYARHVQSKWVYGDGDQSRHFRTFFKPDLHVLGNCSSMNDDDWEYILPTPNCIELATGWDPGDTHQAAVLAEVLLLGGRKHFSFLDELESHNQQLSLEDFTSEFMEIVEDLERTMGKTYMLDRSWTDISAIQKYSASADTFPYLQIEAAAKGRIVLRGAVSRGSAGTVNVKVRVKLLKQLLVQGRVKISANCVGLQRMLRDLKKGRSRLDFVVPNVDKHLFDAMTYLLIMECAEEFLDNESQLSTGKRTALPVQV